MNDQSQSYRGPNARNVHTLYRRTKKEVTQEDQGEPALPDWTEFTTFRIVCGRCKSTAVNAHPNNDATVTFACTNCGLTQTVSRRLE